MGLAHNVIHFYIFSVHCAHCKSTVKLLWSVPFPSVLSVLYGASVAHSLPLRLPTAVPPMTRIPRTTSLRYKTGPRVDGLIHWNDPRAQFFVWQGVVALFGLLAVRIRNTIN
ncbi:hypothetical protein K438DRAFT_439335 [Mycena galopus ATCC 62051]|nr:hypothetical protein K438DRAFT_439335 [Mycena galopus ATCC 62051]